MVDSNISTINLYVEDSSSGERVYEKLLVRSLGSNKYQVMTSPGLVLGLAKDDEIEYFSKSAGYDIIKRGNNICVQIYISSNIVQFVDSLICEVNEKLGGSLDGRSEKQIVFSIPVMSGFTEIENILNKFSGNYPEAEWYYGNVYDIEDGVTPLNWWLE